MPASVTAVSHAGHPAELVRAGALEAVVLPELGMLCASLTCRGEQILGRSDELTAYVDKGSAIGVPLLYPWANRLAAFHYEAAGRAADLVPGSPALHFDGRGLPMHGVPGTRLAWQVRERAVDGERARLTARLPWSGAERVAVFPYPHALEMSIALDPRELAVTTTVSANAGAAVPVSFGFHPYFQIAGVPRGEWLLELPRMRRLRLDAQQIPTGDEEEFNWGSRALGTSAFDDPFRVGAEAATFGVSAGARRIAVELRRGFPFAQVYAPPDKDFIALEPMTAPGNALISGRDLMVVEPDCSFTAAFAIVLD